MVMRVAFTVGYTLDFWCISGGVKKRGCKLRGFSEESEIKVVGTGKWES